MSIIKCVLYREIQSIQKDIATRKELGNPVDTKTEVKARDLEKAVRKHPFRHYGCLIELKANEKCVSFVTHTPFVGTQKTLPLHENPKPE